MKILDCRPLAREEEKWIKAHIDLHPTHRPPCLVVIADGTDPASQIYVKQKFKAAERCGIHALYWKVSNQEELVSAVDTANKADYIDGIIIQQPCLGLSFAYLRELVSPNKDVDGFCESSYFLPCTPHGIIELLHAFGYNLKGQHCVVLGRSEIVGKPLASMLLEHDATVSVCHSRTPNEVRKTLLKNADFIFSCVGKAGLIKPEDVKDDVVIVDVGITRQEDGKICGDAGPAEIWTDTNVALTPVPGGVGPMTVTMLMQHTYDAWRIRLLREEDNAIST